MIKVVSLYYFAHFSVSQIWISRKSRHGPESCAYVGGWRWKIRACKRHKCWRWNLLGFGKAFNEMQEVRQVFFIEFSRTINLNLSIQFFQCQFQDKFYRFLRRNVYLINFYNSFDELLELSHRGNNRVIDMLVGDIYGGMDYNKVYKFRALVVLAMVNRCFIL